MVTVPTGLQTCAKVLQMHLSGGEGTPWLQPKSNVTFKKAYLIYSSSWLLVLGLNIFIIVAIVPTGLQTCAKVLQVHLQGGGGTPWLQTKNNVTFKKGSLNIFKFLAAGFGFNYFHYSGHCADRVANLCKSAANAPSRRWGTPWLQSKNNVTFK